MNLKKIVAQRAGCLKNKDFNQIKYWDEQLILIEPIITDLNQKLCGELNKALKNSNIVDVFVQNNPWLNDLTIKYLPGYDVNDIFTDIL